MYKSRVGQGIERRITGQRIWKVAKAVGTRAGMPALHPHALRHACGAELLRRTKNLRVVQEQLRHVDIQTTTGYTRLTQQDVRQALETLGSFEVRGMKRDFKSPFPVFRAEKANSSDFRRCAAPGSSWHRSHIWQTEFSCSSCFHLTAGPVEPGV
jgi:Phage integrase family